MIYLIFDTNTLIYLLDESFSEHNPLKLIEYWVEERYIKLLVPEIIFKEWGNHNEKETKERKKKFQDFFERAKFFFPIEQIREQNKPEKIDNVIDFQQYRITHLIENGTKIEHDDTLKLKVYEWCISKKAPAHKKSSTADTTIVLSIIDFIEKNSQNKYVFISNNTEDFFQKENGNWQIHYDLKPDFDRLSIKSFTKIGELLYYQRNVLNLPVNITNEVSEERLLQQYIDFSKVRQDSYFLNNTKRVEIILNKQEPILEEIGYCLSLIKENQDYKTHFLKNVKSPIWFPILEKQGYFNPENNPDIIWDKENEGRYSIPFWEILDYLIKLSETIKQGENLDLIDKIIAIIEAVSQSDIKNETTFSVFCQILTNFPNETISIELIHQTTTWVAENHRSSWLTRSFFRLLYKFLYKEANENDKEKAKVILDFLFGVHNSTSSGREFYSRFDLYNFRGDFLSYENLSLIIEQHKDFTFDLALQIKKILLNFANPLRFTFSTDAKRYTASVFVQSDNLTVQINEYETVEDGFIILEEQAEIDNSENVEFSFSIQDYSNYDENWVKKQLENELNKSTLKIIKDEDFFKELHSVSYCLFNDFSITEIQDLDSSYHYDNLKRTFQYILRELLIVLAKNNPNEAKETLLKLSFGKQFNIPFFRRLSLYIIGKEWATLNKIFSHFIDEADTRHYFSDYKYEKELYQLLNQNQYSFNEKWVSVFNNIIEIGPQDEREGRNEEYYKYWQFKWISALRNLEKYQEKYSLLSKELNETYDDVENLNGMTFRSGSRPPMTKEELLSKDHDEIIDFIHNFNPDRWQDANISGFSELIGDACESEYKFFINNLSLYEKVPYIYVYRMIYGFSKAIKNNKIEQADFAKILTFCNHYISTTSFQKDKLKLENDSWNATKDWVIGIIANLISDLIRNNNDLSDKLVNIKEIIKKLLNNIGVSKFNENHEEDYVHYLINSTKGKTLISLLDYALHFANINYEVIDEIKWEDDLKELFEKELMKNDIEVYILLGNYFEHFSYLDKAWTIEKLNIILNLDKEWRAFIGGIEYSSPPHTEAAYELLVPHYYKAIEQKITIKDGLGGSLARHFAANYLNGNKYLYDDNLTQNYLENTDTKGITALLQVFLSQSKYIKLNRNDDFEKKIIDIWKFVIEKYENSNVKEEKEVIEYMSNVLCFLNELSSENIQYILKSCNKIRYIHSIIEDLSELKNKGDKDITANYLGQILLNFDLEGHFYMSSDDENELSQIVEFLYRNNQKSAADEFCNKVARKGKTFLNAIFEKYNN